ncbi:LamG-like jellyroll fold domain-containing protein [Nubsella zeaxanthinifaciens]|uniref:LamG-like jellyroll fold domain-containing protein n=1 Tax=Nubsella zeaxanthinifaciens TaxID=392412 RepID=UPI000DE23636|nr:LamG-like jellyroll fold domain-containing protein [Nubsella zeaxanthinifaciens]
MKVNNLNKYKIAFLLATAVVGTSCKKDGNPNNLPDVDASSYAGKIDGYASSDEVYPNNLVAYWSFEDNSNEQKTSSTPTATANASFIAGVKGKALKLTAGYVYFAKQFDAFKSDALKNFTISSWVQIANNGSKKTMLMTIARPNTFLGSLDFRLNTNSTSTTFLGIGPRFTTLGGGSQDNLNANLSPAFGATVWTHLVLTYNGATGIFKVWADGKDVGSYNSRGTGNNVFKSYEPGEFIIGAHYNNIPGKEIVGSAADFVAMTGSVDELRIYNTVLQDASIKALYNLGRAGK